MTADGVDPVPRDLLAEIVARRVVLGLTVGAVPGAAVLPAMAVRMPALQANARLLCASGALSRRAPTGASARASRTTFSRTPSRHSSGSG